MTDSIRESVKAEETKKDVDTLKDSFLRGSGPESDTVQSPEPNLRTDKNHNSTSPT